MRRLAQLLGASCVAAALPASSYVFAQAEKKAAAPTPGGTTTVTVTVEKTVEVKEAAKPVFVEKKAMAKQADQKVRVRAVLAQPAVNLEPLIQQCIPQIRPMLRAEIHLIRTVCSPTKEQRAAISREGDRVLKEAAKQYAEYQQPRMQGKWAGNKSQPDVRKLIADGLAEVVKVNFTPEQAARYAAETEKRAAETRRVTVMNLVANMDDDLVLTAAQRARLVETLAANWDSAWADMIEIMVNNPQFFPNIPDRLVLPVLTDPQKKAWSQKVKQQGVFFGLNFGHMGQVGLEEADEVEDKKAGAAVEKKP